MKYQYLLLTLLILPIANAEFGFVPKQTINNISYDPTFGKYIQTTIFLQNKGNDTITINLKNTENVITETQITMTPLQRLNIPVTIFINKNKQTETISTNEEGKNYGGVTEIIINSQPTTSITDTNNITLIKAYAEANQYKCTQNQTELTCTSPLNNVTLPLTLIKTNNTKQWIQGISLMVLIGILLASVIAIILNQRKQPPNDIQPN